jgi:phage gp37-like protein
VLSFKSVVHPSPKVWMHYLEIRDPDQVDDEVARWLRDAYDAAS